MPGASVAALDPESCVASFVDDWRWSMFWDDDELSRRYRAGSLVRFVVFVQSGPKGEGCGYCLAEWSRCQYRFKSSSPASIFRHEGKDLVERFEDRMPPRYSYAASPDRMNRAGSSVVVPKSRAGAPGGMVYQEGEIVRSEVSFVLPRQVLPASLVSRVRHNKQDPVIRHMQKLAACPVGTTELEVPFFRATDPGVYLLRRCSDGAGIKTEGVIFVSFDEGRPQVGATSFFDRVETVSYFRERIMAHRMLTLK